MREKAVVVFSGGIDSTTLLYDLRSLGYELKAISVDYGQRHGARELASSRRLCKELQIEQRVIDLGGLAALLGNNSLSNPAAGVPEGHYESSTMQLTTVPNRNMILIAIGIAWAVSLKFDAVAFGAHAGQYTPYPDCRPDFAEAMHRAAQVCDWNPMQVLAPFVTWDKGDIVKRGFELGVPFGLTWSCYNGREKHCGRCGTCIDRKEAFAKNNLADPTGYEA